MSLNLLNQMSDSNSAPEHLQKDAVAKFANILKNSKGTLNILIKDNPTVTLSLGSNRIALDIHDPSVFSNIDFQKESSDGIFENLRTLRKFGEILNSNGLTLIVSRKGKEAITLGRDATPTLSSIITGSDDIHIDSISQVTKLSQDVSKSRKRNKASN